MCAIGEAEHFQSLLLSQRPADLELVANPQASIRFRRLAIGRHLSGAAGFLSFRARAEQTRDIEPHIEPYARSPRPRR